MTGPVLTGHFRTWWDPWGFIVCPASFEGDLFAHRLNFAGEIPVGPLAGATVRFRHGTDTRGRPQAIEVSVVSMDSDSTAKTETGQNSLGLSTISAPGGKGSSKSQGGERPSGNTFKAENLQSLVDKRLRGEVRSWKGDWGFIICPSKFEGDLFCHRRNLQLNTPVVAGKPVSFTVTLDGMNRPEAATVSEPEPSPEDFVGGEILEGRMRSWRKDWGFIIAPEHFEGDLFCYLQSLPLAYTRSAPGEVEKMVVNKTVQFQVTTDNKGRPCASNVIVKDDVDNSSPQDDVEEGDVDVMSTKDADWPNILTSEVLHGTMRTWRDPWGFISCPERFPCDLFVHGKHFAQASREIHAGDAVSFQICLDSRGRPHAFNVVLETDESTPTTTHITSEDNTTNNNVQQESATSQNDFGRLDPARFIDLIGKPLVGTVRSWKSPWGFITSPEHFYGDLFVHTENLPEGASSLTPGSTVSFQVSYDRKGRAVAVKVAGAGSVKDWVGNQQTLQGFLRSWKDHWGFIASPANFPGDLFCHMQSFNPPLSAEQLGSGVNVLFSVDTDKKGRCVAANARLDVGTLGATAGKRAGAPPDNHSKRAKHS